ncbi:bifunctional diguanylate cyclase/phosphodiesterase [Clostridium sp. JN-9]|uniref:sensor domain-containing protein n=1 Tax=Clostridium sp. JN-9 TaxID=2507159 RepID=UPI000FFE15C2|nr:bifunctional diguanylate cyclase/phosphodiesterase [Clostridium sp. JN-9]QAT41237.1 bifunctional diguanylate cyclase/phosphodiesterase [Clostridium sp. JN-9]
MEYNKKPIHELFEDLIKCKIGNENSCEARNFLLNVIDNASIIIDVWYPNGDLIKFNKYAQKVTGFSEDEVLGQEWRHTIADESINLCMDSFFIMMNEGAVGGEQEDVLRCKDGSYINVLWSNCLVHDDKGNLIYCISMGMNITQLKNMEKDLSVSEERYRLAFEGANDGLWDMNLLTLEFYTSKQFKGILDLNEDEIISYSDFLNLLYYHKDLLSFKRALNEHISRKTSFFSYECRIKTKPGNFKWILIRGKAVYNSFGSPVRIAGSITDVTKKKNDDEVIKKMAYYDQLTGMPNKSLMEKTVENQILKCKGKNKGFALFFMDIDNFKSVNDTYGHNIGDALLKEISNLIKNKISILNDCSRFGGDQFIFLQRNTFYMEDIVNNAEKILNLFKYPINIKGKEISVSASIGIALYPKDGCNFNELLKNADIAVYYAKEKGKKRYLFYSKEMNIKMSKKLKMERDLIKGIKNDEFLVYYQPQIDLSSGKLTGMEALVRWNHPKKGIILPLEFIPLAEETGLIMEIGKKVLYDACKQNAQWQKIGYDPLRVSVNLSAKQFEQENLVDIIQEILSETGLDPKWLNVEITESIVMLDFNFSIKMLNKLRNMGIHVSLDDFGTGYSSLNYLKLFPIDVLKIDKSFLNNVIEDSTEEIIARAIIELAHKLNLYIIAEGVENIDQLNYLKRHNCQMAQGFLFSEPVPKDEFEKLLKDPGAVLR